MHGTRNSVKRGPHELRFLAPPMNTDIPRICKEDLEKVQNHGEGTVKEQDLIRNYTVFPRKLNNEHRHQQFETPERKGANSPGNERDRLLNAFTAALRVVGTPDPQIDNFYPHRSHNDVRCWRKSQRASPHRRRQKGLTAQRTRY